MIMKNVLRDNANLVALVMIIVNMVSTAFKALARNHVNQAKTAIRVTIVILIMNVKLKVVQNLGDPVFFHL